MHNRLRLLQAATALLYLGPLLAGLAGQGWAMIPLFTAIFVLWSVIVRPHLWPTALTDFTKADAIVPLASLIATQILLVTLCFALGRGTGGVMGLNLALPFYWPAALSFLSIPLSRMVWNPDQTEAIAGFDPLLHKASPAEALQPSALAQSMVAEVLALPDDVGEADLQAHLTAISAHIDALHIRDALERALRGPITRAQTNRVGAKAMIVHATDPDVAQLLSGTAYPAHAFTLAAQDDDLLILFATRCARALEDDPPLALDCPAIPALTSAAQTASPEARAALLRLAGLLRQNLMSDPTTL